MKKRILSAILSVAVAFTALTFVAFAEVKTDVDTGLKYEIITTDDGEEEVAIFHYDGDDTEMVIPSTIEGLPVTSIGSGAFHECTALSSVTIPDSVTSIGEYAFSDCTLLESVTIPDSVTSIAENAFDNTPFYDGFADGLVYLGKVLYKYNGDMPENTTVEIKEGTTSIANRAFSDCTALSSVTIPDSVTYIGEAAFFGCTSLESVTIPDSVTSIGEFAFSQCTALSSVTIPDSVTSIGRNAFYDTPFYDNLDNGVVYFGDILYAYKGDMPENTTVEIKEGTTAIVDDAFSCYSELKNVTIPDSVTSIGDGAFNCCTSLESVTIPDSLEVIEYYAFSGCTSLKSIIIPDSVTSIGDGAFNSCTGFKNVTIPDSVTSIGEAAFSNCTSLESVTIPDSVTDIGYNAFSYCTSLESVTIPDSVTRIGFATFSGCTALESVTIPDSVIYIGESAFSDCTALTDIYFIGTEEEWNEINYQFDERATVHFSSITTTPTVGSGTENAQVEIEKDVVNSLLTDEDLSSGEEIRVETKIDVLEKAPEEDAKAIETMAKTLNKDITQLQVLDIDLTKYVGNTSTEITDLNGKEITITVDIPENLRDSSKTFAIVRVHDGVAEILDDLDTSDETITFKTGKFSTYAIVEVKNVAAVVPGDDDKDDSQVGTPDDDDDDITDTENPKTGENTNMIFLSIIALVAVAGIYGAKKKLVK